MKETILILTFLLPTLTWSYEVKFDKEEAVKKLTDLQRKVFPTPNSPIKVITSSDLIILDNAKPNLFI